MREEEIPDHNIFMMCKWVNKHVFTDLNTDYYFRNCRPDDLELWKGFPFDSDTVPVEYEGFMNQIISDAYGANMDTFSRTRYLSVTKRENQWRLVLIGKHTARLIQSIG